MDDSSKSDIAKYTSEIRSIFIQKLIRGMVVLVAFGLPITFAITPLTGFSIVNIFYTFITLCVILGYIYRSRLSEKILGNIILFGFMLTSLTGLFSFGMISNHMAMTITILIMLLLHGYRVTVIFASCYFIYMTFVGIGFNLEYLALPAPADELHNSLVIWVFIIFTSIISISFIIYFVHGYQTEQQILIEKINTQRREIQYLADHDSLTNLPTLRLANERIDLAINIAQRKGHLVALLFIDLDGFKMVNDTYGHEAGDELLKQIALRYNKIIRNSDTACRIGGDEFLVILSEIHNKEEAKSMCERLIGVSCEQVIFEGYNLNVGASIGVAFYPQHGTSVNQLKKAADHAMYSVKKSGKNNFAFATNSEE